MVIVLLFTKLDIVVSNYLNWIQVAPVKLESMFNICCVLFIYLFIF